MFIINIIVVVIAYAAAAVKIIRERDRTKCLKVFLGLLVKQTIMLLNYFW
jgi:hypothetical protein